jgi:hypothetical protein
MKEWAREARAWIQQKPDNRSYSGYHISQEMALWILAFDPTHPNSHTPPRLERFQIGADYPSGRLRSYHRNWAILA